MLDLIENFSIASLQRIEKFSKQMKRKKGLFSLMQDCEKHKNNRSVLKMKPVRKYNDTNHGEVTISKPTKKVVSRNDEVDTAFYDFEEPISLSLPPLRYRYDNQIPDEYVDDLDYYVEPFEKNAKGKQKDHPPKPVLDPKSEKDRDEAIIIDNPKPSPPNLIPPKPKPPNLFPPKPERMPITTEEIQEETIPMDDDDSFEADLKAILSGKKKYDAEQKQLIPSSSSPISEIENIEPEESPKKNEHEIFDKIAQSMQLAKAYDLGSINLERRFDAFDQELDQNQNASKMEVKSTKQVKALEVEPTEGKMDHSVLQSIDTQDFLEDLDKMSGQQTIATAFSNDMPLAPDTGGRMIGKQELEPGDIILSTTDDPLISGNIRKVTRSEISHAGIYIGDGKVIEAIESGVLERSLETAMTDDSVTVTVAFRHQHMTTEKATIIKDFLVNKRKEGTKFDRYAVIRNLPIQIITSFCSIVSPGLRDRCRNFAGRIFLGTETNNEFYCSELVFAAFEAAGLKLANTAPHWTSAEDLVQLSYNGTLRYVGHLKTS